MSITIKITNYVSNEGKVKMDFHSIFPDDSAHNSATIFEHMKNFIHWMYYNNLLVSYVIIYDAADGCRKNTDVQMKSVYYISWNLHTAC